MPTYDDARELVANHYAADYPDDGPERHYIPAWGWMSPTGTYAIVPHGCWGEFHDDDEPWTGPTRDGITAVDLVRRVIIELPGQQDPATVKLLELTPKVGQWPAEQL